MKGKNNKKVALVAFLAATMLSASAAGAIVSQDDNLSAVSVAAQSTENANVVPAAASVAKVGDTEYTSISEAIANWTNGTTLTLLADVTLEGVINLSSTEYHVLDLGTYTMTAASKNDAIQIVNNGRSSASYALDIKADATNPGGITATGKAIVRTTGKINVKDRPIIRFYNGVFNGSHIIYHSGSNGTNCPQFQFYGGVYNGTIYTNRALNQFYGGTFTGSMQMSVDSSAYTLIAGGTFKNLSNLMGSTLNSGKFTIGSGKGVYDKEVYVDDNGNYVIAAAEPAEGIEAGVAKTPSTNDYLAYSKVATEGQLNYTDAVVALTKNNTISAKVTIYADEVDLTGVNYKGTIAVPEGNTLTIITEAGVTPTWKLENADSVEYKDETGNTLVKGENGAFVEKVAEVANYDELVAALAEGGKIQLTADIAVEKAVTVLDGTVIDLNGKTLNINVENSSYGNATIKNGNIVLGKDDVHVCDGYFLVKEGKTLVVESVNVSSSQEGIKGYAVFHLKTGANLDLTNSELNIHDNEYAAGYIVYAGESTATVDVVDTTVTASKVNGIVHAATVIENSTFTITNATEHGINRSGVTITDSTVAISGGAGRGITAQHGPLVVKGNSTVNIKDMGEATIELRNDQDLTIAETATVQLDAAVNNTTSGTITGTVFVPVVQIGENYYETLEEAVAAAQAGEEIVLLADVAEDATVPAGVIFNGNGKQVGVITAAGEITFKGYTKATNFGTTYTNTTINIGAGACLELTGTGRMVIGHGCTFNITGTIADAKTAEKANVQPSLIMPGASFTGAGVTFNVTNAYVYAPSSYCSSSSSASGTFDFNITNSIIETAGKLAFEAQSVAATVNFELKDSVLTTGSHLVFGVAAGEVVIDNSNVNVGKSNQIENRSTMTIKNGSVVNGAVATSSNAINPGTIIVEEATYAVTGQFSGAAVGTGTLVIKKGANVSVGSIVDNANVQIDATDMTAGDEVNFTGNLSKFTGAITVVNNDKLEGKIVDGKIVLAVKPVASIGDNTYTTVAEAIAAAQNGDTVTLFAGEFAPINVSNKNITIQGTVGADGELLTTIKGGNPAITAHGFNGTIKDLKIVDAFKVMYAEPAGNVTVDNIYVTGATYGLHLVAYTTGSTWTIQNSYMDLAWANSFGVSGGGDAAIVIKGNEFASTKPYYPDYGALPVNTFLPNVTVEGNVFGEKTKINIDASITDTSKINISKNYHADGVDNAFVEDSGVKTHIFEYYADKDKTQLVKRYVQIGENYYATLADAVAAAQAGDEIVLLADVAEDVIVPAGVIFNGNGKQVGVITAAGEITFKGYTKATKFSVQYTNTTINIGAGACLEITGADRMVIGHGCTFNITGTIADAKTAEKANVQPSLIMPGASFTGAGVTFNVTDAYVKFNNNSTSKNSNANGTFNFNVTNSIWDQTGVLAFYVPTSGMDPTFNLTLKDSVLTTTSHLVFSVTKGEIVIDNSNVNVGTSRQIENRSTMTIKNGSVVNGAVATSSNAINPGTIIVEDATYAVTGQFSGAAVGTGTLVIKKGATVSVGSIVDNANVQIDATDMTAGDEVNFTGNLSKFTGDITVVNNDKLEGKIVDGKIVLAVKPVASINGVEYGTLVDAFKAATVGCTIEILADVVVDFKWDCRDYAANGSHSQFKESVTINGNGHTIKFTGAVNDSNWNTIFRFEENATVNNLTIDISEATGAQRIISAKKSLTVDGLTVIGSAKYGVIFGEGASAADLAAAEIVVKNSTLTGTRRAISDNEGGKDVKSVTITGNTLKANAYASASQSIVFTNNVAAGEVDLRSYAAENTLSVVANDNTLTEGVKNYIYAKDIEAQGEFAIERPAFKVSTKAELDAAIAAVQDGDVIELLADITTNAVIVIDDDITFNGNGYTITSSASRVIRIAADVTINNLKMVSTAVMVYPNDIRGVSVDYYTANDDFDLVLNNCSVRFTDASASDWSYAVNQSGNSSTGNSITIIGGNYSGANVININGVGHTVKIDGATLTSTYGYNAQYYGLGVSFNDGANTAEIKNTTFEGNHAKPIKYKGSEVVEENNTDNTKIYLVQVGSNYYHTFAEAYVAAQAGDEIVLFAPIVVAQGETLTIEKNVKITYTSDNVGEDMITVRGELNVAAGTITYINTDTTGNNVTVSTISCEPGSVLNVTGGAIENKTVYSTGSYAYAIDMLTNGNMGDVTATISGGKVYSDYMAIRQFNNGTACKNTLTVTGGEIYGAKRAIQIHLNNDAAHLTISGGKIKAGDYALCLFNTYETVSVSGGEFTGSVWYSGNHGFISGGTFSEPVEEAYCAEGLISSKNADGTYGIVRGLRGEGTEANPYIINNVSDLEFFRDSVNAGETKYNASGVYVALAADVDLAGRDWSVNIGDACNTTFDGIFDGKGYTIKNLTSVETAQTSDGYICTGLFGAIYGSAQIKNLTIENVNINVGDYTGNNVGAVVGFVYAGNGAVIENVSVIGDININAPKAYGVGAIVGYAYYGSGLTIKGCSVVANDGSAITASSAASGIIGYSSNYNLAVENCTVKDMALNATAIAGGLAGVVTCGNFADNTVESVAITVSGANWKNSAAIAVGTLASTSVTVSNTTHNNVNVTAIVGSQYAEKPTAPVAKVQAKIGDTYYYNLAAALKVAQEGETIVLFAPIVVAKDETLTIDKNVNITYTSDVVGEDMITVRGELNVAAGTITYINTDTTGNNVTVSTISCEPGSVLNVTGGTIENKTVYSTGSYAYAIDLLTNGNMGDVTATISGGTVYSDYMAIRQFNNGTACKNTLTVTGGEIYGAKRAIQIHLNNDAAHLTITGGKIEAGDYALCLFNTYETVSVTGGEFIGSVWYSGDHGFISGGKFSEPVEEAYCAEGYIPTANADGTYGVKEGEFLVRLNGVGYETLADAVEAAKAGETITLLGDVQLSEILTIDKAITIDTNNHTLRAEFVLAAADVTLTAPEGLEVTTIAGYNVVYEDGMYVAKRETKFQYVNLSVGVDLSVNFYVSGEAEIGDGVMNFSMLDLKGTEMTSSSEPTEVTINGQPMWKFTFKGVGPHLMGNKLTATLVVAGEVKKSYEYSIKDYAYDQLALTKEDLGYNDGQFEDYRKFLVNMLNYGAESQKYMDLQDAELTIPASELVTANLTEEQKKLIANYHAVEPNAEDDVKPEGVIVGKVVILGSKNKIEILLQDATGAANNATKFEGWYAKVYGNGYRGTKFDIAQSTTKGMSGFYSVMLENILVTEYDNNYDFFIYNAAGEEVGIISYSVQTYVFKTQNTTKDSAALTRALWNYYHAAEDYIDEF